MSGSESCYFRQDDQRKPLGREDFTERSKQSEGLRRERTG